MNIFSRKSKKKKRDKQQRRESAKPTPRARSPKNTSPTSSRVLIRPLLTEKAAQLESEHKYVFQVHPRANKVEIRKAIESAFNVHVEKVAVVNEKPKLRMRRGIAGATGGVKKAIVTIAEGEQIEVLPT